MKAVSATPAAPADEVRAALRARQEAVGRVQEASTELGRLERLVHPRFAEWTTGTAIPVLDPVEQAIAESELPSRKLDYAKALRAEREAVQQHDRLARREAERIAAQTREQLKPVLVKLLAAWGAVEALATEADAIAAEGHGQVVTMALDGTGFAVPGALALSVGSSQVWRAQATAYFSALRSVLDPLPTPAGPPAGRVLVKALKGFSVDHRGNLLDDNNPKVTDEALSAALLDTGPRITRGETCAVSQRAADLLVQRGFAERIGD